MNSSVKVRTIAPHRVIERFAQRGLTHVRSIGSPFKTTIVEYVGRHQDATFIQTAHDDVVVMLLPSNLIFVLKAFKETENDDRKDRT